MKIASIVSRYLLGLIYFVFGLNKFLSFIKPDMSQAPEGAQKFMMALAETGYMFPIIGIIEVLTALAFFSNRFVALAAVLAMPITLNIFLFHIVLDQMIVPGILMGSILMITNIIILLSQKERFEPLLKP